jgi:hypothetical protein
MKKVGILFGAVALLSFNSCTKCHDCHYDLGGSEVELGEYCGDDLKSIEETGIVVNSIIYDVHCGEDH